MKIIQVINVMITNHNKITNVIKNKSEYYFIYDDKYKWSILKAERSDDYSIHLYPSNEITLEELASTSIWDDINIVSYYTRDMKTQEAYESFRELYQIVSGKIFGVEDIFDSIINQS